MTIIMFFLSFEVDFMLILVRLLVKIVDDQDLAHYDRRSGSWVPRSPIKLIQKRKDISQLLAGGQLLKSLGSVLGGSETFF